jgi:2-C-methyl-D-erythritol 4-phosphate cytidylyltransferase
MQFIDIIIVAAGSGTRLGSSLPKAFVPLMGKPLLTYSMDTFLTHHAVRSVILVVPESMYAFAAATFRHERIKVVVGGEQRWQSVNNGLSSTTTEWVMIHDAARPFVTNAVIDNVIKKQSEYDCVITVTPEVDTIRMYSGDKAGETVDRDKLIRVGTPQMFKRELLFDAFGKAAVSGEPAPTDEAILMQKMGIPVGIAWGDPTNFKITTQADLEIAEALIARSQKVHVGR